MIPLTEDKTALCCFIIKVDWAIKIMLFITIAGAIGSVWNVIGCFAFLTYGLGGVVLLCIIGIGQLVSIYCDYKFIMVFYPHAYN